MSVPVAPPPPTEIPASLSATPNAGIMVAVSDHKAPVSNASALPAGGSGGAAAASYPAPTPVTPAPPSSVPVAPSGGAQPNGVPKASELPSFEPALSNIQAIPNKKLLMVVNTFILNTTDFLNKFAAQAERKLARVSKNVQRLEIVMSLLEAKLDSIKYINESGGGGGGSAAAPSGSAAAGSAAGAPVAPNAAGLSAPPGGAAVSNGAPGKEGDAAKVDNKHKEEEKPAMKLKDDPRFTGYFKLLRLQVPKEQVRMKLTQDGLDPSIIDKDPEGPTLPGAPSAALVVVADDGDDSGSEEGS